ncbi:MAG: CDP-glycerol glycerophosphotransferase family protein [Syntrophobacterales bacterium]|nr:CDP-glycerol glycerophosphotransferase family protein [Syntrophobacterales bacterium]
MDKLIYMANSAFFSSLLREAVQRQPRNSNIVVFVSEGGIYGNTKYAFIGISKFFKKWRVDVRPIWFGSYSEKQLIESSGFSSICPEIAWQRTALTLLKAKIVIYGAHYFRDINSWFWQGCLDGALKIQLWHGIPAKHVGANYLIRTENFFSFTGLLHAVSECDYVIAENEVFIPIYSSSFPTSKILPFGAPRNDFLVNDDMQEDQDYYMGNDLLLLGKLKELKNQGKKLVMICPTYPEAPSLFNDWIALFRKTMDMSSFHFILKLHPWHPIRCPNTYKTALNICNALDNFSIVTPNEDVYPYLKLSDALITDYSSIRYDYVILGKPIINYRPNVESFKQYRDIPVFSFLKEDDISITCFSSDEVIYALKDSVEHLNEWKSRLSVYAGIMHRNYDDGKACERLAKFVLSYF